jgi:uncharacterized protein YqjF (DUF2071 family)
MPKKKSKAAGSEKVFVRGGDGALYILTKDRAPYKLKAAESKSVERILKDAGKLVEDRLKVETPGFGSMVNLTVPSFHIFP